MGIFLFFVSIFLPVAINQMAGHVAGQAAAQSAAGVAPTRDQVLSAIATRVTTQSQSPVSAIVTSLLELVEVGPTTVGPDGKATVIVKETTPSNQRATNKSVKLVFAPTSDKEKWNWEQFEDNRRLYPVDRLFPYVKTQLDKLRAEVNSALAAHLDAMTKEGESATKVLETVKALLKSDPAPLGPVTQARAALAEAKKGTEIEAIAMAHRELENAIGPVLQLGETYNDLKANDAYLRLHEELKAAHGLIATTRENYFKKVDTFNDEIRRLPYALVAYGMEYTKIEPKLRQE